MRILADENCDGILVSLLRSLGHDVSYVAEWGSGTNDFVIYEQACSEQRILITNDQGFGALAERASKHPLSILMLRLDPLLAPSRAKRVADIVSASADLILGQLVVIEPHQIRYRPLKARQRPFGDEE